MIITILSSSTLGYLDFDISTNDSDTQFDIIKNKSSYGISSNIERSVTSRNSMSGSQNQLSGMSHGAGFNALIESETRNQDERFNFYINESSLDTSNTLVGNKTTITPSTISPYDRYDEIRFDVDAMSTKSSDVLTSNVANVDTLNNASYVAQGLFIPELRYSGTSILLDTFTFNTGFSEPSSSMVITGSIWSAKLRSDGYVIPDQSMAITNATTNPSGVSSYTMEFDQNVTVSASETWTNSTGGYVFILIEKLGDTDSNFLNIAYDDTQNTSVSYYAPSGITNDNSWGSALSQDYVISYTSSLIYDPSQIDTKIELVDDSNTKSLLTDGLVSFNRTTNLLSEVDYNITYNGFIPSGRDVLFNISYHTIVTNVIFANVEFQVNPTNSLITWTILLTNNFDDSTARDRFLLFPNNFTITDFDDDGVKRNTVDTDYEIISGPINNTLNLLSPIDAGTYTISATSTNLFRNIDLSESVYRSGASGWTTNNHTAFMGNVSNIADTDTIQAYNDISALNIIDGTINATLRSQDGTLDSGISGHENVTSFTGIHSALNFTNALAANLDTGVWSVQFHWSNGTAAAAISTEFVILPQTSLEYLNPIADFNVLEADSVRIDVGLYDWSHTGGRWISDGSNTDGQLVWDFGTPTLTHNGSHPGGTAFHNYTATLDLTKTTGTNVQANTVYTLNSTFTDGVYTIFVEIDMTVYHRGGSNTTFTSQTGAPDEFQYGTEDVTFDFTPLNLTDGSSNFDSGGTASLSLEVTNSTDTISLVLNTDYTVTYSAPTYSFDVAWSNTTFELGSSNTFTLTWSVPELRQDADISTITTAFSFTAIDTDAPIITDFAQDETITEQQSNGHTISWTAVDDFSSIYTITNTTGVIDNDLVVDQPWTSGVAIDYTFSIELWEGTHTYEITFEDQDGQTTTDSMTLTVEDAFNPVRTASPANVSYAIANDTNSISWTFTDKHPNTYQLYIDEVASGFSGSWSSGVAITIDISGLSDANNYNLTMVVTDDSGNIRVSKAFISIDRNAPTLTQIPNLDTISYNFGETDNSISWQLFDSNPDTYSVLQNGTVYNSLEGSFTDSQLIIADIDGFGIGAYNFTIVVYDTFGNVLVDTTILIVTDANDPVLNDPTDFSFEFGTDTPQTITWSPSDDNPGSYELYKDDVLIDDGPWSNGLDIEIDVTNDAFGEHNYTLVIYDSSLNQVSSTVIVTVVDTTLPEISSPDDTRIFDNQTDYQISWDTTDLNPSSYVIYQNGDIVDSGPWSSTTISYNIGPVEVGLYNFTIVITDLGGNSVQDTVFITVKSFLIVETNELDDLSVTDNVLEGDVEQISGNWSTLLSGTPIDGATIEASLIAVEVPGTPSGTIILTATFMTNELGEYELVLDYTGLDIGVYLWRFNFSKALFESKIVTDSVEINPHNVDFEIEHSDQLVKGEEFTISVTVTYNNNPNSLGLYEVSSRSGGVQNVNVTLEVRYINGNGESSTLRLDGTTDENGVAIIRIPAGTTRDMVSIESIGASINGISYFNSSIQFESTDTLPTVIEGDPDVEFYVAFIQEFVEEYWQFILIGLVALLGIFFYLNSRAKRNRARKAQITQEIETATEEVEALMAIQAIILKNTESGIPFYNATFEQEDDSIDLSLISSLTTAISTFLSELQSSAKGFETMEREGIQLVSHRGELSDFIIISKQALPVFMYQQIQNSHAAIETKFSKLITNPAMIYEIPEEEINKFMRENNLKLDLKGLIDVDPKAIDKARNNSRISRNVRNNMVYLLEYADLVRDANLPITLTSLIDFLETKEINFETASRLILVAYANGVLIDKGS